MKKKVLTKKKLQKSHSQMNEETSENLLSAARKAFFKDGFHGTSMDELCASVKLTRGALYHHFGSKEGLLEAVVLEIDKEIGKEIETEFNKHKDPWIGLLAASELSLQISLQPEVKKIYHKEGRLVLGERIREIDASSSIKPIAIILHKLMESKKIKKTDPEILAIQINACLMELAFYITESLEPEKKLKTAFESFRLLISGLLLK